MKKSEIVLNLTSIPVDAAALFGAGLLSYYARPRLTEIVGPVLYQLSIKEFLVAGVPSLLALLIIFALLGLYNIKGNRKVGKEAAKIILGVSAGLFVVVILFFFNPGLFPSRFIILSSWLLAIVLAIIGRSFLALAQTVSFYKGIGLHKVVIINGSGQDAMALEKEFADPVSGYKLVKEIEYSEHTLRELSQLFKERNIDEVVQSNSTLPDQVNADLLEWCRERGLSYSFVPNLFQAQQRMVEITQLGGVPLISIKNTPLEGWGRIAKRIADIIVSGAAMVVLSPVFLILFFAVRITSPGPAIYPQIRGGKEKDFWFYKFRSMYTHLSDGLGGEEAEKVRAELWKKNDRGGADSPFLKIKNDPRVTPVGRFIRKTKLDEIPQFWNVFRGDMSLVGPRAHMLAEVNLYRDKYRRVFSIKPGIFGISQIEQIKSPDLPFEEEMRLCVYYIENWSLWMDIKILVQSAYLIFFGKRAKDDY